jgi:Xaa-Pro aminopeptidase
VRAHMADRNCLTGGSGSGRCGGSVDITRTYATGKPTTNLLRGA